MVPFLKNYPKLNSYSDSFAKLTSVAWLDQHYFQHLGSLVYVYRIIMIAYITLNDNREIFGVNYLQI